jgi:cell division septal protein FtsQ
MFELFFKIVLVLIIALIVLFLIWLIAFLIHIARDEIAMENNQKYSSSLIDMIVNTVGNIGLLVMARIYQLFKRPK